MPEHIKLNEDVDFAQCLKQLLASRTPAASAGFGSNTITWCRPTRLKRRARAMLA